VACDPPERACTHTLGHDTTHKREREMEAWWVEVVAATVDEQTKE